jgi:hypothetical protein
VKRTCWYAATTKVKRNAADGLFTKPSGFNSSETQVRQRCSYGLGISLFSGESVLSEPRLSIKHFKR